MTRKADRPEWLVHTPPENYRKGVHDAAIYLTMNRPIIIPNAPMRKDHGFWAGIVARCYGVSLEPRGRT